MIPTTHGILQQKQVAAALIEISLTTLYLNFQSYNYTLYCSINVTPDTIVNTITKINTGQGTSWAYISPASATGDRTFRAMAYETNYNSYNRSMILRITDNAGVAPSVDITLTQGKYGT